MDHHDKKNINFISDKIYNAEILVDVGAFIGDYTDFFLKKIGENGKVYSFELNRNNFNHLFNKFKNLHNVFIFNMAVSDINENISFYGSNQTSNILGYDVNFNNSTHMGYVESIRLDKIFSGETRINLIKIDVEGAEIKVLNGMSGIIDRVDSILLECHLDRDWDELKKIIFEEYKLKCLNVVTEEIVDNSTNKRPYQLYCTKNYKI